MSRRNYQTVPQELIRLADMVADDFAKRGFSPKVEVREPGFPNTPTLVCTRGKIETVIVEVMDKYRKERMEIWAAFAKSYDKELRVAFCVPQGKNIPVRDLAAIRHLKVGLYRPNADGALIEEIAPADLALNVSLPDISKESQKIRELLGPVYEKFARHDWFGSFEDACWVLEEESRKYFIKWSRTGRLMVVTRKRGAHTMNAGEIKRLTLGQLKDSFGLIQAPNRADTVIQNALAILNPDRKNATHRKKLPKTHAKLRKAVGRHMWVILEALREIHSP